jgi:hypothetical protein
MTATPIRDVARLGASGLLVTVIMLGGSLLLWIGVPVAWLYIAAQVQAATRSIGLAIMTALLGATGSILALATGLRWLDRKHEELRRARGAESATSTLEKVMVLTAAIAVIGFTVWFLGFAGPGPTIAPR